ncbi:MAG: hypothetical protein KKF46_05980 [Nanoarchaeota archaeon]|nr:hypothetical protein [Nanoarchaeota archaeon]MBU1321882.1 hypothetical protein [Nanoarchaeota archaeon]MBU1597657.1 hypothetical protein [Nanoarchaeota archaeon]MBU2442220.1 hypothetical protein [Nanoarchaeota archaeon]
MDREELITRLGKNITYLNQNHALCDVVKALLEPNEYYKLKFNGGYRILGGGKEGYRCMGVSVVRDE